VRSAQASRRTRRSCRTSTSTSLNHDVPAPAQVDRVPSALRATSWRVPAGCSWRSRSPVDEPRNVVSTRCEAKPARTCPADRARAKASARDRTTPSMAPWPVKVGGAPKSGSCAVSSTRGMASSAGGAPAASASLAATRSATSTAPPRLATPTATPPAPAAPPAPPSPARSRKLTTVTRRSRRRPLVVVVLLAKRTSASLPSLTTTTHPWPRATDNASSTTSAAGGSRSPSLIGPSRPGRSTRSRPGTAPTGTRG
jgi:hypothetical protein